MHHLSGQILTFRLCEEELILERNPAGQNGNPTGQESWRIPTKVPQENDHKNPVGTCRMFM